MNCGANSLGSGCYGDVGPRSGLNGPAASLKHYFRAAQGHKVPGN